MDFEFQKEQTLKYQKDVESVRDMLLVMWLGCRERTSGMQGYGEMSLISEATVYLRDAINTLDQLIDLYEDQKSR